MFYHIEGLLTDVEPNFAVIDCNGVGYCLFVTMNTLSCIEKGSRIKLYVTESISENNFDLYGFATKSEKKCFDMLISVSGIGPKAALSILSYNTPDSLARAILNNDDKALTVAPGIGKKTALRVILELKDKFGQEFNGTVGAGVMPAASGTNSGKTNDAVAALNILGYSNSDISRALNGADVSSMTTEQIIKYALKNMDR